MYLKNHYLFLNVGILNREIDVTFPFHREVTAIAHAGLECLCRVFFLSEARLERCKYSYGFRRTR